MSKADKKTGPFKPCRWCGDTNQHVCRGIQDRYIQLEEAENITSVAMAAKLYMDDKIAYHQYVDAVEKINKTYRRKHKL